MYILCHSECKRRISVFCWPGVLLLKRVFHAPLTKDDAEKERKEAFLKKTDGKSFTDLEIVDIKKDLEKKIKSLSEK